MDVRCKGFTLIELLVTMTLIVIFSLVALPAWQSQVASNRADADSNALYRALNFARLEAINRGVNIQLRPVTDGAAWNTDLQVNPASATGTILRSVPAPASGATMTVSSSAGSTSYIEFNNLGVMVSPAAAVTVAYVRGTQSRSLGVCVNGRVYLSGTC